MSIKNVDKLMAKLNSLDSTVANETIKKAVSQGGLIVQTQARMYITSDSHALKRSVKVKTEQDTSGVSSTVYTKSDYAAYYEFGTGPNGQEHHDGISPAVTPHYSQKGWMIPADAMSEDKARKYGFKVAYKNGEIIGYYTRGQMARPFMYPALHDHKKDIMKNTEKILSNKIKEICKR